MVVAVGSNHNFPIDEKVLLAPPPRLDETRMRNFKHPYVTAALVLTPLWFVASFILMLRLVDAEDPGRVIGEVVTHVDGHEIHSFDPNYKGEHQGELPPEPLWPKIAFVVAYPMQYLLPEDGFVGLPEHANAQLSLFLMFVNSVLWAILMVFLFRRLASRIRRRRLVPAVAGEV